MGCRRTRQVKGIRGAVLSSRAEDGGVGETQLCPLTGDGNDSHGGGGSSPDDGAEVVGIGPVLLSTKKLTDCWLGGSRGEKLYGGCAGPGTSAARQGGRRRGLRPMILLLLLGRGQGDHERCRR